MGFSFRAAVVGIGCALILGGCVSSGTYQLKEQESRMLSKNLEESRSSYAELQNRFKQLQDEKAELESELKKQKANLGDSTEKNQKLMDTNGNLTADLADARSDNDKLKATNGELSDKLRKLAVDFVEIKTERDNANLANLTLSGKMNRLSSEMAEVKAANQKLTIAVKPENLLKTMGEYFELQQQKLDGLGAENAKLKMTVLEMRGSGRAKVTGEFPSRAPVERPAAQPATQRPRPLPVSSEPTQSAEKPHPAEDGNPLRETAKAETEDSPTTHHIPDEEPIALPQ